MKYFNYKILLFFMALALAIPPAWAETETVCSRTTTNSYVPVCLEAINNSNRKWNTTQMIYPAATFTQMTAGSKIKSITFYVEDGTWYTIQATISSSTFEVRMGEVSATTVTSDGLQNRSLLDASCQVYNATPTISSDSKEMTFTLTGDGYTWNGGNLAIELYVATNNGNNQSNLPWKVAAATAGSSGYSTYNTRNSAYVTDANIAALPQMTITYESSSTTPTITVDPANVNISDETGDNKSASLTATVSPSGSVSSTVTGDWTWENSTATYNGKALHATGSVKFSADNAEDVTANLDYLYTGPLYILGWINSNGWGYDNYVEMTRDEDTGLYTARVTTVANTDNNDGYAYISFSKRVGTSWDYIKNYRFVPESTNNWWFEDPTLGTDHNGEYWPLDFNPDHVDGQAIKLPVDMYDITINPEDNTFMIKRVEQYQVTVTPDGGTINFGNANYVDNGTTVKTIYVKNTGLQPVTPTLSALEAPFTTDYTAAELQPGESVAIYITFAPTEETTYNGTATLSFGHDIADRTFTLTGQGIKYGENDHSAIYDKTYEWTDDNGTPHVSNLLETATDANQIIAMLRKIYMTPEIPGNKYRGYTEAGALESLTVDGHDAYKVNYSAVGQLNSDQQYTDTYGWNIPTEKPIDSMTMGSSTYYYMDPTEYEPNEEGLTLVMIEIKDGANNSGVSDYYSFGSSGKTLKEKVADNFKSARIITTYKKSGSGEEAGTLFKIDADKLNRFFFLAKGQLRLIDHSESYNEGGVWTSSNIVPYPSLKGSTFTDNSFNSSSGGAVLAPFEHMFEEFSPNQAVSSTSAMTDVYQDLVNMASYEVIHDCVSIPFVGGNHEFNMYGVDSQSEDCQDVRDMMFFVPDYRMKYWAVDQYSFGDATRDPNSVEKFVNYNQDHRPTLGLYVIRQNEITGEQKNDNAYELHLSWESNLLDFLPGDEGQYFLYRVITDANGNKTYEPVVQVDENGDTILVNGKPVIVTLDPNTTTYTDYVALQETGQMVTYAVQGQDATQFLSLQMSNEESYIIPGLDKSELLTLSPKFDHYSRFDPDTEANYYANQLKVTNNVGTNVKGKYLGNGAVFTFYRIPNNDDENKVIIATATSNGNGTLTIAMQNQNREGKYNRKGLDWIKMNNPSTVSYTGTGDDAVTFSNFTLYDNFCESVIGNNHPGMYAYQVELAASQNIDDTEGSAAHSNKIGVTIHKTALEVESYTMDQVDGDTKHTLEIPVRTADVDVKYSSKTEILRYDAYRWNGGLDAKAYPEVKEILDFEVSAFDPATGEVDEEDVAPTGIAGNQATYYTIAMNDDYTGRVNVDQTMTQGAKARFEDTYATQNPGLYTYAPVVETFTTRGDYNTYGAELAETGVASFGVEVASSVMSSKGYNAVWEKDGKKYCHYTVTLRVTPLNMPEDYDLYMVRAWRKVAPTLLSEQEFSDQVDPNGKLDRSYRLTEDGEYMMEEVYFTDFSKLNYQNRPLGVSEIEKGTPMTDEVRATFGAQKLAESAGEAGCITELPMNFIVRAYYTRSANTSSQSANAPRRIDSRDKADEKYFIAEATLPYTLNTGNTPTSVNNVAVDRVVTGVTYYNMMGQSSSQPFSGVNVKVTRYSDGTTWTTKVIK